MLFGIYKRNKILKCLIIFSYQILKENLWRMSDDLKAWILASTKAIKLIQANYHPHKILNPFKKEKMFSR